MTTTASTPENKRSRARVTAPPLRCTSKDLWKIFGRGADKIIGTEQAQLSRKELQEQTGHVVGIRDVSFDVSPGEVFVVMGLSGSGKSTLVRLLTRLIEPTAGKVELYGDEITGMADAALLDTRRRKVSMVFQHFGLLPHRKVIDNVAFGLEVRARARATAATARRRCSTWSGSPAREHLPRPALRRHAAARRPGPGARRRPRVLMFDEPFCALDPLIRRDMQDQVSGSTTRSARRWSSSPTTSPRRSSSATAS